MGANQFYKTARATTASAAFNALVEQDQWESGHQYSGGIGMKHDFFVIKTPAGLRKTTLLKIPAALGDYAFARSVAENTFETPGQRAAATKRMAKIRATYAYVPFERLSLDYNDKWGPALCLALPGSEFVFFGLASS